MSLLSKVSEVNILSIKGTKKLYHDIIPKMISYSGSHSIKKTIEFCLASYSFQTLETFIWEYETTTDIYYLVS